MSHRAAIYTVRVYPRNKRNPPNRLLGDFDESGSWLGDTLNGYLTKFQVENMTKDRSVECEETKVVGTEVRSIFAHGRRGTAADIIDPNQTIGFWAVHINSSRSAKALAESELVARFRHQHDDLMLKVTPAAHEKALMKAIAKGRIDTLRLTRVEKPKDHAVAATDKWVDGKEAASLELTVKGKERFLKADLLKRYFNGDAAARASILEFENITFTEAKIAVELDNGDQRTFNIESPDAGHAFTADMPNLKMKPDGDPTPASLYKELRRVMNELG